MCPRTQLCIALLKHCHTRNIRQPRIWDHVAWHHYTMILRLSAIWKLETIENSLPYWTKRIRWHTRIFDQGEFKAFLESSSVSTITYREVRLSFQPWTWKLKNWVRKRLFCLDKCKSWTTVIKQLIQHGHFAHWSTSLGGTVCPDHHLSNHWVPAPCLDFWQPSADSDPPTNTLVVRHPAVSPTQVQFQDATPWNHTWTDVAHFDFSAF